MSGRRRRDGPSDARRRDGPSGERGRDGPSHEVLYGRNPIREALAAGRRAVGPVWATAPVAREPWLAGAEVVVEDAPALSARAGTAAHQGLCALAAPYPYADAAALLVPPDALVVVLDEVQDPQNLGAICRSAECAGATGVVLPQRRTAEVTPAVAKASAGAVEHLAVARVRNLADWLREAKEAGAWCYGAAAEAETAYDAPDFRGRVVLVLGAEGRGLRPRVAAGCDALLALPLRGRIASLNVSAAAAVLLYEILQRRQAVDSAS